MRRSAFGPRRLRPALFCVAVLMAAAGCRSRTAVILSEARFQGLTRIVATSNVPLEGLDARRVVVTRPDGRVVPAAAITDVAVSGPEVTVGIAADQFARICSEGATIAVRAFGPFGSSPAVPVARAGEPAANGHIIGTGASLDEGWNTIRTDPSFIDPVTGFRGLYRCDDVTPDRDDEGRPVEWNDGRVTVPVHRSKTMLMLLVEFPDRRAADAEAPYDKIPPYVEFLTGAAEWFDLSSYGQFRFDLAAPQAESGRGWIMMDKKAADYQWGGSTAVMFAYIGEACQKAYDLWGIEADAYDLLVVMPARGKAGLHNGPANINRRRTDPGAEHPYHVAYIDREGRPRIVDTAITAGNDLFRWGYRWAVHESGHTFGLPDIYTYGPMVDDVKVGSFFYCGGWDMMGFIAGHSNDFLAWHKWKLRWIRDDQVDVVTRPGGGPTTHVLSPVETPGGSKMVVIRTGLSTAYIAEFRTRLGLNALDDRGRHTGVLIYRIDASRSGARGREYTGQIISKKYYHSPEVGGPQNLTGLWRPVDASLDGYDSPDCCWQPGDEFSDPATGVTIRVEDITGRDPADHDASPYTVDDAATITVMKTMEAPLCREVALSDARLAGLTELTVRTSIELRQRISRPGDARGAGVDIVREDSLPVAGDVVITRADGSIIPAENIAGITVEPDLVRIELTAGAFAADAEAAGATVAFRAFYNFCASAPAPVSVVRAAGPAAR